MSCRGINGGDPAKLGRKPFMPEATVEKARKAKFDSGASLKGSDGGKSQLVGSAV